MASDDSHHCGKATQSIVVAVLPHVMTSELLLGFPGNVAALWIFCHQRSWSPAGLFLLNLAVADSLLMMSMPLRIDYLMRGEDWLHGDAWCRLNLFMLAINRSASIGFMTIVAVDRYFKVVYPHHRVNRLTLHQALGVVGGTWTAIVVLRLPLLTTNLQKDNNTTTLCRSFDSYKIVPPAVWLHQVVYLAEFFLPLLLLIFCSSRIALILRNRQLDKVRRVRRAIRTVLVIVFVFVLCFMPGIVTGLTLLLMKAYMPHSCVAYRLTSELFSLSIGFTYLNSALDPLIYCFSSSMFRNSLREAFNKLGFMEKRLNRRGSRASDGGGLRS